MPDIADGSDSSYVVISSETNLSKDRTITAGDGISLVDGGVNSTITLTHDNIDFARKRVSFIDDMFGNSTSGTYFQKTVTGTGADVTNLGVSTTGVFGVWEFSTGTTATGKTAIGSGNNNSFSLGQGIATFEAYVKIPTLSTTAQEFSVVNGFSDSLTATAIDAVRFSYDRTVSVNWQIQCKSNSVSTTTTTATAVGTGWTRLKIVVNAAGTSVSYYIDGTEVSGSPITTNIPTGAGREVTVQARIDKSVGLTASLLDIDYIAVDIDLTTSR